jgi:hypothetical protein
MLKVTVFLYLIIQAPRHEDVWVSGDITSTILDLRTTWRRVLSLTSRPQYPIDRRLGAPRSGLDAVNKRKSFAPPRN